MNYKPTKPQEKYLQAIREAGFKSYNGRARKPLQTLKQLGLIDYYFTLVPHHDGRYTKRFDCYPIHPF